MGITKIQNSKVLSFEHGYEERTLILGVKPIIHPSQVTQWMSSTKQ